MPGISENDQLTNTSTGRELVGGIGGNVTKTTSEKKTETMSDTSSSKTGKGGGTGRSAIPPAVGPRVSSLRPSSTTTPRIDISRASSSSHQDSRDSSPENVFDQVRITKKI